MQGKPRRSHHQAVQRSVGEAPLLAGAVFDMLEDRLPTLLPREEETPQPLHRAMRHAVLSGGKRLRPRLLLAVAEACAAGPLECAGIDLALRAACAVEFIHAASLVHDDLPIFDDANERRGRPTVHVLYGEALAVLAGDALLARAFEVLADVPFRVAPRALQIIRLVGAATGSREGIIGGQSMEPSGPARGHGGRAEGDPAELPPDAVDRYHALKSAALFRMAASAGAVAMEHPDPGAWGEVGYCIGRALQLADDLLDTCGRGVAAGKPVRRDAALGRPNAVLANGEELVRAAMLALVGRARSLAISLAAQPRPVLRLLDTAAEYFAGATA